MSPEDSLATAQRNKIEHTLKKLALSEGETLLDIGCGWGELILTAAKKYHVKATAITLSMWRLYLNSCAASFNCGNIDVHQFLFSKGANNTLPWVRA